MPPPGPACRSIQKSGYRARLLVAAQKPDGGWSYTPDSPASSASMTCAGLSSLGRLRAPAVRGAERSRTGRSGAAAKGSVNRNVQMGIDWLAAHFRVNENFRTGRNWKILLPLWPRAGGPALGGPVLRHERLVSPGRRGAVARPGPAQRGLERGPAGEGPDPDDVLRAAVLGRGRAPVLIQKVRHAPLDDWNRDPGDVAHLVEVVARDWKVAARLAGGQPEIGPGPGTAADADPLPGRPPVAGTLLHREVRTCATTSSRGAPCSLRPAAARPTSTAASAS